MSEQESNAWEAKCEELAAKLNAEAEAIEAEAAGDPPSRKPLPK